MACYLFNVVPDAETSRQAAFEQAAARLRAGMWGVGPNEVHRGAMAPGDLVVVYVGGTWGEFIGHARLASAVHDWEPSAIARYPGDADSGVLLADTERWDPGVPVDAVLSRIDPAENASDTFGAGVVRITADEYRAVLSVSAGRA